VKEYVRDLLSRYRSPGVIIDANLLLLLLVGDVRRDRIEEFRSTRNHFVAGDYDRFKQMLTPVERFVVTPQILTEVSNFLGQASSSKEKYALRGILAQSLSRFDIQDVPLSTLVSSPDSGGEFNRFGFTDAVIIHLARQGYLAITIDFVLANYITSIGMMAFNYTQASCANITESKWA